MSMFVFNIKINLKLCIRKNSNNDYLLLPSSYRMGTVGRCTMFSLWFPTPSDTFPGIQGPYLRSRKYEDLLLEKKSEPQNDMTYGNTFYMVLSSMTVVFIKFDLHNLANFRTKINKIH